MFQILGIDMNNMTPYILGIESSEDPYIVDVRENKDDALKEIMGKDYLFIVELQRSPRKKKNGGFFRVYNRGKTILSRVIGNAKKFDREIILLYTDEEQYERLLKMIQEEILCQKSA